MGVGGWVRAHTHACVCLCVCVSRCGVYMCIHIHIHVYGIMHVYIFVCMCKGNRVQKCLVHSQQNLVIQGFPSTHLVSQESYLTVNT